MKIRMMAAMAAAALGWAAVGAQAQGNGLLLDSYAAVVSGKIITMGEVLDGMRAEREALSLRYEGEELDRKLQAAFRESLDRLVEAQLVLAEFKDAGGDLPERAIEDHVNGVIREQFGNDQGAFLQALGEARLTYAEWREQMKEQLILQAMRQREVAAKVQVTPLDVQERYDRDAARYTSKAQVRLRLVSVPPDASRKVNLGKLAARLQEGAVTLEAVEKHFKLDVQEAEEPVDEDSLNETLLAALEGKSAGDVAGPVALEGTEYLVQVLERVPEARKPLAEVRESIEAELRKECFDRLYATWMETLRSKHYVEIYKNDLFR